MPEKETIVNWKSLTMPSLWVTAFTVIYERIMTMQTEYIPDKDKRGKNYAEQTLKILKDIIISIEEAYKPQTPRTLQDAFDYALQRKYKGTFLALMNEADQLVTVSILKKGEILDRIPSISFEDKVIEVKMTQHLLMIPELDIARSVSKNITKFIPFSSDRKAIRKYQ